MSDTMGLAPYLSVRNAAQAIDFYGKAFGAQLTPPTLRTPDGVVMHAEMAIDRASFMLSEEAPAQGGPSPESLGGTTVRLHLMVHDAEAVFAAALKAGAQSVIPVALQFYGHLSGRVRDPFGHLWIISQVVEEMSEDEMQRKMNEMMGAAPQ